MSQPFRIPPALPVHQMKSYRIVVPRATHWRPATCAESDCQAYLLGWLTTVDEGTDLGRRQAHYIRRESGRRYREERTEAGLTDFTFEPGQKCFAEHELRNDRPERFLVTGGDHRGNPTGERYEHAGPEQWTDDFATHQDRLAAIIEKG